MTFENYKPGDIVYRRGSPQSFGVVTDAATREELDGRDEPHEWGRYFVKVTWKNPSTGNRRRVTNETGPDEWLNVNALGGPLQFLIDEAKKKVETHTRNLAKARAWAKEEGLA